MEDKKQANTDTTYCVNKNCKNKCWRNADNYKFDEDKYYWFTNECEKE